MRLEEIEDAINAKREEMIQLGMAKGLLSEETISCSQELDKLHNEYNRLLINERQPQPVSFYYDFTGYLQKQVHKIVSIHYQYYLHYLRYYH